MLKRSTQGIVSLLVLSAVIFGLTRLAGDPAVLMLSEAATQEEYERLRRSLGLDRPLVEQYVQYMRSVLSGDLGASTYTRRPVLEALVERVPNTFALLGVAAVMTVVVSLPLGVAAGARPGSAVDSLANLISSLGQSVPVFFVGFILIQIFSVGLKILPSGGDAGWQSYLMPAFCIALFWSAGIIRVLRSAMVEAMKSEYVRFARVKGMAERRVVLVHALRNSLLPVAGLGGMYIAIGITSTIVVEAVFGWPGMGNLAQLAIANRDFPTIQGIVLATALIVIMANIATDVLYALLDPRVRLT